ncbi:PspC domain-containing protein [Cytobacillus sp. S13-E01]|uniref:PspC domain-containing protein n=1 Tax=Cytobacillus sp. S13-E01 TaxID=3031326 RepID=UPI0023D824E8|nr:PspC domain-containing protein [Cytobacillus sp. S13-E01]MDF0729006.1 PspC domain-containing protein [Cytobacillus sp. S13-E01]
MLQKLTKSTTDRMIFGICGGIGEYFGISSLILRVIFFVTAPVSIFVYILLIVFLVNNYKIK